MRALLVVAGLVGALGAQSGEKPAPFLIVTISSVTYTDGVVRTQGVMENVGDAPAVRPRVDLAITDVSGATLATGSAYPDGPRQTLPPKASAPFGHRIQVKADKERMRYNFNLGAPHHGELIFKHADGEPGILPACRIYTSR